MDVVWILSGLVFFALTARFVRFFDSLRKED
jgi:hypothetical protein